MKRQQVGDLERFARYLLQFKLTGRGRALVMVGIVTGLIGHPIQLPILYLFTALFSLGFVALIVNAFMRPRCEVSGAFPSLVSAGQPVTAWFSITNRSKRTAFDVGANFFGADPTLKAVDTPDVHDTLAPGARVTMPITITAERRGMYRLPPLRTFTTYPFSLCRSGRATHIGSPLIVAPSFHPLAQVRVPAARRYQPGGIALTSDVGESPEYIGNREYRPGDSPRRIDFRSWARLARPVVREYQEEFYCRIALVLDTYVPSRWRWPGAASAQLEAGVSMAAAIADALSTGEHIIDIFAAGPELYVFRSGRHTAHFENVLEILACVDESKTDPFDVVAPALADELSRISTVVCVLLDWDLKRSALVQAALDAGCDVKVVLVRDKPCTMPADEIAGLTGEPATVVRIADVQRGLVESL
ncbi:MAG TPA: DUF58 domain-containing protein [Candidatus Hydrogenedentes bacterium]|nr:DUF58 domain-containing protein [Candidatus Hydrogenedentota bacterium]